MRSKTSFSSIFAYPYQGLEMIPLALGFGFAGAMCSPMALVIMGGLIASGGLAL